MVSIILIRTETFNIVLLVVVISIIENIYELTMYEHNKK